MLEVRGVTKVFQTGGLTQKALKGVSVNFRENEFASILGPSGSGKTTLLNIIGGLDNYTSGDLRINEVSTKNFKDKDWDAYRNHRIGFVFQSYNLIPHQTILKNVALALTLSGVSKKETIKRAKDALKEVGLEKHINKRPNQLSGGQMQRVAIARALVNNPDILLADEPTGALDSETSVQIMELLKKIADKKLVIMVTHNPELAEKYSTRIITLKDGLIIDDTNPYDGKVDTKQSLATQEKKQKKTKMSFFTSFSLSLNNLLTKKARTILIAIAGSIGIIGIALILAVSNGFQRYIDDIEEETMTSYPLTIMSETSDVTSLLLSVNGEASAQESSEKGRVKENKIVANMLGSLSENDLKTFKKYLDDNKDEVEKNVENMSFSYGIDPLIYAVDATNKLARLNPSSAFSSILGGSSLLSSYSSYTSVYSPIKNNEKEYIESTYEAVAGRWPEKYDEMVLVLNSGDRISDFLLYSLGLKDTEELSMMIKKIMAGESVKIESAAAEYSYEDLMNVDLRLIQPSDFYRYNPEYGLYEDMSEDKDYLSGLYDKATKLKIVGIYKVSDNATIAINNTGVFYLPELVDYIIDYAKETNIVKDQIAKPEINVISGKRFDEKASVLDLDFRDFVSVDSEQIAAAFGSTVTPEDINNAISGYMATIASSINADTSETHEEIRSMLYDFIYGIFDYLEYRSFTKEEIPALVSEYLDTNGPAGRFALLQEKYLVPAEVYRLMSEGVLNGVLEAYEAIFSKMKELFPDIVIDPDSPIIEIIEEIADKVIEFILSNGEIDDAIEKVAVAMSNAVMQRDILNAAGGMVQAVTETIAQGINVDPEKIASAFELSLSEEQITRIITSMLNGNDATAKSNLLSFGYADKENPAIIYFYFTDFDGKDRFLKWLDEYNGKMPEEKKIKYSDTTGVLMSSVKTIVDAVTYVLIAFVSISLVVSSIMIGVITYISVYERTKEIGILRAIGASKRNISGIFNAETFIIGLLSGLIAMAFSFIAIPIINSILLNLTGIHNLQAYLGLDNAFILIVLSIVITLIGGLIPARSASKKDPVEALRTE